MRLMRAVGAARAKLIHYAALRELTPDHMRLALRKLIKRYYLMRFWLRTRSGLSVYMSEDPLDDLVLESMLQAKAHIYFPPLPWATAGGLVVDLGAWHGFYTLEALRRYPGARVVAVEPDSWNCALLRRNLAANGLVDRAEVIEAAVGSSEGSDSSSSEGPPWSIEWFSLRMSKGGDGLGSLARRVLSGTLSPWW
ncbi:MAG: FkbM family methyltransferase [Armatimonadota bacterium]|nr:FkbM family methyltransferase [Armatimonadota bacterium]MDR7449173.1 FkbM family methyltransferase [Armatimonadota bacterium]MDR7459070.1 FkbM family methyltransferase [Armatimonadota bacterium]MDR7479386.1 FkbM family methyltransferase [Armatimonadota bacterium]MDR7487428.1 FkbM family methyltransferase [Armatimonadota bacterium]